MSHRIADQHLLHDALDLLNPWQRDFPLVSRPFLEIAKQLSWSRGFGDVYKRQYQQSDWMR